MTKYTTHIDDAIAACSAASSVAGPAALFFDVEQESTGQGQSGANAVSSDHTIRSRKNASCLRNGVLSQNVNVVAA